MKKPNYSQETRDALERGAERGKRVIPGGAVGAVRKVAQSGAKKLATRFSMPGQKAVKIVNGWATKRSKRILTTPPRGSKSW